MNRFFVAIAFLLGATAVAWVGSGFVGAHVLALSVTGVIGAVYLLGSAEIFQFRRATATLANALATIPDTLSSLDIWLDSVHPSLQNAVRLRIEGERMGLPGPALTPYLVGLLVMLGMLGTFVGMVVTLNGAVFALEGTTDLQAIRSGLAAPIKGLGLAFGTSVAGVAASAMLGLISTLSRRERMLTAQSLDKKVATVLRGFSLAHHRQEAFKALQFQAQALPDVVDKLQAMAVQMERMSHHLNDKMVANQDSFHASVKGIYMELASSVDKSLKDSLAESGRMAGESIKPLVESAMVSITQAAHDTHQSLIQTAHSQQDGFSERFSHSAIDVANTWKEALALQERSSAGFVTGMSRSLEAFNEKFEHTSAHLLAEQTAADQQRLERWVVSLESMAITLNREWQQSAEHALSQQQKICTTLETTAHAIAGNAQSSTSKMLSEMTQLLSTSEDIVRSRMVTEEAWTQAQGERMEQLTTVLHAELSSLREEEASRGKAAVEQLAGLQAALASHLTTLGTALEAPMTRLIETASEAPRAAAELIAQLRQEMSNNMTRDNTLLDERGRIMEALGTLLNSLNKASFEQRTAIETLVNSSAELLNNVGTHFTQQVGMEASKLSDIAAQVTGSAIEVSSLSEAFAFAVQLFSESNNTLIENLSRIEASMDKSTLRSDEQLAYYVAQAREIIDLSMLSQKEIVEELRQLSTQKELVAAEVS